MNCIACHFLLPAGGPAFVVCPQCGTVNVSNQASGPSRLAPASIPQTETPPAANNVLSYNETPPNKRIGLLNKWVVAGAGSLIIIVAGFFGVLTYQNSQANALLHSAQSSIAKSDYENALKLLDRAGKYPAFSSTKKLISVAAAKDRVWVTDQKELNQAKSLVEQGKYSEASALLLKINKDFPGYSQVTALNVTIAAKAVVAKTTTAPPINKSTPPKVAAQTQTPAPIVGKRFVSTAAASSLAAANTIAQAQQALQSFASQYGLGVEITSVSPSSYVTLYDSYSLLAEADLPSLKSYGSLFIDEWAKYPKSWVQNSGVKNIVLVKNLAVQAQHRAATPDVVGFDMYYDVSFGGDYAREVIHHEYDHLITYKYFGGYAPSDPAWLSYNPPGFSYGSGGASCYNPGNTCLSGEHPIPGFATGYGASAIEEDKAELYAYLMETTYYHHLKGWLPSDPYLTNKVNNYKQFITSHSPEMAGSYFDDINP